MPVFIQILTIAAFVARYRADYVSCAANSTGASHVYGQQCYQVFGYPLIVNEYASAKQVCQDQGGSLAVVIGKVLRETLAGIIQTLSGSEALVALYQLGAAAGGPSGPADNWYWYIDGKGELQLATSDSENRVEWHTGEPDDDLQEQQYGALMAPNATFKDSMGPFQYYICQFRKEVATLARYGVDQMMTVNGMHGGQMLQGVTLGGCAVACYANPSCMANTMCQQHLVRPQDTDPDKLNIMNQLGAGIWVKE